MTVTFLVAVDVTDVTTLAEVALDIQEDLERAGHSVESVKPWARPTTRPVANTTSFFSSPAQPTELPPTL